MNNHPHPCPLIKGNKQDFYIKFTIGLLVFLIGIILLVIDPKSIAGIRQQAIKIYYLGPKALFTVSFFYLLITVPVCGSIIIKIINACKYLKELEEELKNLLIDNQNNVDNSEDIAELKANINDLKKYINGLLKSVPPIPKIR